MHVAMWMHWYPDLYGVLPPCDVPLPFAYPRSGSRHQYPLRVGIIGDVGQTANSTTTRNHLAANKPQVSAEPHVLTQQGT